MATAVGDPAPAPQGGHAGEDPGRAGLPSPRALAGRLASSLAGQVTRRIPGGDLDERDPDHIRERLPGLWLIASLWFRGEVRGLGNVPASGPVLLVGNHSGGNVTPDTLVLSLAFSTYFGVERAFYQLAHNPALSMPGLGSLRTFGAVADTPEHARRALAADAALLVYPGGDHDVHRPSWQRHRIDFDGRRDFVDLALEHDVPIVPVVSVGGQETALFLARGGGLARALRLDKTLKVKALPLSLALPWGVNVGDVAGHLPLPAKLTIEALPPIHLREEFGADPDPEEVHDHVVAAMQDTLDALAAERRFWVVG